MGLGRELKRFAAHFARLIFWQRRELCEDTPPDPILHAVHLCAGARRDVVVAVQVQQAVDDVEREFPEHIMPVLRRLHEGGVRAHDDFAVIKSDHIRRARLAHELHVDTRDDGIAHDGHLDRRDLFQRKQPVARVAHALRERHCRKLPEPLPIEADAALPVDESDLHRGKTAIPRADCQRVSKQR